MEINDWNNNKQQSGIKWLYISVWALNQQRMQNAAAAPGKLQPQKKLSFIHYICVTARRLLGLEGGYDNDEGWNSAVR